MIITGKTKSGFKYTVNKEIFTSWAFTRCLKAIKKAAQKGEQAFVESMDLMEMALGEKQLAELEQHLLSVLPEEKTSAGVQAEDMTSEIMEIIHEVEKKAKN